MQHPTLLSAVKKEQVTNDMVRPQMISMYRKKVNGKGRNDRGPVIDPCNYPNPTMWTRIDNPKVWLPGCAVV